MEGGIAKESVNDETTRKHKNHNSIRVTKGRNLVKASIATRTRRKLTANLSAPSKTKRSRIYHVRTMSSWSRFRLYLQTLLKICIFTIKLVKRQLSKQQLSNKQQQHRICLLFARAAPQHPVTIGLQLPKRPITIRASSAN